MKWFKRRSPLARLDYLLREGFELPDALSILGTEGELPDVVVYPPGTTVFHTTDGVRRLR